MKILAVYSTSHSELYDRWFLPSLPSDTILESHIIDSAGDGQYLSEDWYEGVMAKLYMALRFCRTHPGETFVVSDVDIQFFRGFSLGDLEQTLTQSGKDILFQKENMNPGNIEANTGFYVARATIGVLELLEASLDLAKDTGERNDQNLVNLMLREPSRTEIWGHLPSQYYARSHGFPPSNSIVLHHANMTASVAQKISQLRRVRRYVEGGLLGRFVAIAEESRGHIKSGKFGKMLRRKILAIKNKRKNLANQ